MMVILPLLGLTAATMVRFAQVRAAAAWLVTPYLVWTCYEIYVNLGVLWLNPSA